MSNNSRILTTRLPPNKTNEVNKETENEEDLTSLKQKKQPKKTNRTIYYDDLIEHLPEVLEFSKQLKKEHFSASKPEAQRLTSLLILYQEWIKNSINPHLGFDECIAKIEKLGSKQQVKDEVFQIRLKNKENIPERTFHKVVNEEPVEVSEEERKRAALFFGDENDQPINNNNTTHISYYSNEDIDQMLAEEDW